MGTNNTPMSLETVYGFIYELHNNPSPSEKKQASLCLETLQNSVEAWMIADNMLHQKRDMESCYFAAQTIRIKIQKCFHELPPQSYESLRDSLLQHISQINQNTNTIIVTQLCLALADLILQMTTWQDPITDLLQKFASNEASLWPLLEILKVLPEELNSRYIKLGANRRQQLVSNFTLNGEKVLQFLNLHLKNIDEEVTNSRILKCFTSWISIHAISFNASPLFTNLINHAFMVLQNNMSGPNLHDAAADCISIILQVLEEDSLTNRDSNTGEPLMELQKLQFDLFTQIVGLESAYHESVAHEDMDKSINYCRIFTELAETFLETIVLGSHCGKNQGTHYAIKSLDFALMCVGHHDYEVAQITFNLWYRLSEMLFKKEDDDITIIFKPHVERLISALCRHCQMEPDHLGLIEEGDAFADFRERVFDLIKDVVFVIGSCHCFRQMFALITGEHGQGRLPNWDMTEAALFVMYAVAKNILPQENDVVPKVVEAILQLRENAHIAVRHTSLLLLGELCEWIFFHPQSLEPILNFLLAGLSQEGLGRAASNALQLICGACSKHMTSHFQGLLQIARSFDNFAIDNEASISLLKGITKILSLLPKHEIETSMKELCWIQATPLCSLLEKRPAVQRGTKTDPVLWIDRLAAIFRHFENSKESQKIEAVKESHPCLAAVHEMWPVLSNTCAAYQQDARIIERCCRCLRFMIRCVKEESISIIEPLVKQMVELYKLHHHSSFLYLGSILVDIFGTNANYVQGLLSMLEAFLGPTFTILQEPEGMVNHPDTVDDLFRLCDRFLRTASYPFLSSSMMINSILDCALQACSIEHKDANGSVMKFFYDFIHSARGSEEDLYFNERRNLIKNILNEKGQLLVRNLLWSCVFDLPFYMFTDIAEVIVELNKIDKDLTSTWLGQALEQMPRQTSTAALPAATDEQLKQFHDCFKKSNNTKDVVRLLRDFSKLYR